MKSIQITFQTLVLTAATLFTVSCSHTNIGPDDNSSNTATIITSGAWVITNFTDDGNNETAHFSGYTFTFSGNGQASASNGSNTVSGSWSTGNDDSKSKLNLDFGSNDPWEELTEDWEVISRNASSINLKHVSGGNGGTDLLTFQKK